MGEREEEERKGRKMIYYYLRGARCIDLISLSSIPYAKSNILSRKIDMIDQYNQAVLQSHIKGRVI